MCPTFRRILPFVAALTLFACGGSGGDDVSNVSRPLAAAAATGSDLFQPPTYLATGTVPIAVAIGDVNGDGRNDVVAVTATDNSGFGAENDYSLLVWLQNPDGTLAPLLRYPLGGYPNSVAIGDVNGDGHADVVVSLRIGIAAGIGVLIQNADGTLNPMVFYPTNDADWVRVADLNNDGRLDIVGAGLGTGTVTVYMQNADGTLAAPVTYTYLAQSGGSGGNGLKAGDVNHDGLTDVVVENGSSISILYQQPDGTLGGLTSLPVSPDPGWIAQAIGLGDVNGDGLVDIVEVVLQYPVVGTINSGIITFLQNRDGTMGQPTHVLPSIFFPSAVEVADVNGDKLPDVVMVDVYNDRGGLGVHLQQADGTLGPEQLYPFRNPSRGLGLAVGDINGDGINDVVIANVAGDVVVFLGQVQVAPTR